MTKVCVSGFCRPFRRSRSPQLGLPTTRIRRELVISISKFFVVVIIVLSAIYSSTKVHLSHVVNIPKSLHLKGGVVVEWSFLYFNIITENEWLREGKVILVGLFQES